ncbi:hypothetical protein OFL77_26940, partial [Escherichia coli]|uniref:hypothetical protein n=1 Tax=Escherichia coli TaxID=562 RepID=UPI0021E00F70
AQLNNALFGGTFGQQGGKLGGLVGSLFRSVATPLSVGMDYVPRDNFPALLHRGERVMTAAENAASSAGGSVVINQTINVGQGVSRGEVAAAS